VWVQLRYSRCPVEVQWKSSGSPVEIQWTSTGILEAERNIEDNIIIEQNSSGI